MILQRLWRGKALLANVANFVFFRRFLVAVLGLDVIPEMFRPFEGLKVNRYVLFYRSINLK